MAKEIWVKIGSGNSLLPYGTKPLPKANVDLSSVRSSDIHLITEIIWKIKYLKFHSNFPGANELILEMSLWTFRRPNDVNQGDWRNLISHLWTTSFAHLKVS